MKFFVPAHESSDAQERLLDACASFTGSEIPSPRIYSISFTHNGKEYAATVGEPIDSYFQAAGPVFCILKRNQAFTICLHSRGVHHGEPILVGTESASEIEYFDDIDS